MEARIDARGQRNVAYNLNTMPRRKSKRSKSSIPTYDDLMNPILSALHHLGGSASTHQIEEMIIRNLNVTKKVTERRHHQQGKHSRTELNYRLSWAFTYLKRYGVIHNPKRGIWVLTSKGLQTQTVDPQEVVRFYKGRNRSDDSSN